jgi:hypothetical protein
VAQANRKNESLVGCPELGRVTQLVADELDMWLEHLDEHPIEEFQDLRAFLIVWVSRFIPEAIPPETTYQITARLEQIKEHDEYRSIGWYRALPLEIAAFFLTSDDYWLSIAKANLSHHKSSMRTFVEQCLAWVADRISLCDDKLRESVRENLRVGHHSTSSVLLLAATNGQANEKRTLFREWLDDEQVLDSFGRETMERLVDTTSWVENPFLRHFLWVHQYVTTRLLCPQQSRSKQRWLPGLDSSASDFQNILWSRIQSHPLCRELVTLDG